MPTYVFARPQPVESIMDNDGYFGPPLAETGKPHRASVIYESINVFAEQRWAIVMEGTHDDLDDGSNPFFEAFIVLWNQAQGRLAPTGHLMVITNIRSLAHSTLHAKYRYEDALDFIEEFENVNGHLGWYDKYVDAESGAFIRDDLVTDAAEWSLSRNQTEG